MNEPSTYLLKFAEVDTRICFVFNTTSRLFIYLNPAFERFFQVSASEATYEKLLAMVHPDDVDLLKDSYKNLTPGSLENNIGFRIKLPDQKNAFLGLSMLFTHQQNNDAILTGYVEDRTSNKDYTSKLQEYSNKKNAILNILSHDLSGPLGSIQMFSSLLSRKTQSYNDSEVERLIETISKICRQCIHLIQEFIKDEFRETAGTDLIKKRVDLNVVIRAFLEAYVQTGNDTRNMVEFKIATHPIFVEIDEAKFVQAINNLISNALKFTPDQGKVNIEISEKVDAVLITISDNGIGIPEKFHTHLFDKFNVARRTGLRGEPSVGLGMSIIKTIVEWHNGKIWFESKVNEGTKFFIEIPRSN